MLKTLYFYIENDDRTFPMTRFFLTGNPEKISAFNPAERLPKARNFEAMGQFFMRSGSGANDTYATFTVSGTAGMEAHRHYDNNNFVIYKKGLWL